MSLEKIYGNLIALMFLLLMLAGVARCGEYLYYTIDDIVNVEAEQEFIDLPTYEIIGEDN